MSELKHPEKTSKDLIIELAKTIVEIPTGGTLITYGLSQFIPTPFEKRSQSWMKSVDDTINDLGIQLRELQSNERFVTVFMQASQIALRNHQEKKLTALRNAVVNSISPPSYNESMQINFLHLIDRFTEWHIVVLEVFGNDVLMAAMKHNGTGRDNALRFIAKVHVFFEDQKDFLILILSDLTNAYVITGFIPLGLSNTSNDTSISPYITRIGKDFLAFIKNPTA